MNLSILKLQNEFEQSSGIKYLAGDLEQKVEKNRYQLKKYSNEMSTHNQSTSWSKSGSHITKR